MNNAHTFDLNGLTKYGPIHSSEVPYLGEIYFGGTYLPKDKIYKFQAMDLDYLKLQLSFYSTVPWKLK